MYLRCMQSLIYLFSFIALRNASSSPARLILRKTSTLRQHPASGGPPNSTQRTTYTSPTSPMSSSSFTHTRSSLSSPRTFPS